MANSNPISPDQCKILLKYSKDILAVSRASELDLLHLVNSDQKGHFGQINGKKAYRLSPKKLEAIRNNEVFNTVVIVVAAICVLVTPFFLTAFLFAGIAIPLICIRSFFTQRKFKKKLESNMTIVMQHWIKDGLFPAIEKFKTPVFAYKSCAESRKYYGELLCDVVANKQTDAVKHFVKMHEDNHVHSLEYAWNPSDPGYNEHLRGIH